ncbi:MAG: VanZ family protein [Clostridium sp.]
MDKRKVIRWGLLIGWMGFIFFMSHQNGETSSNQSGTIVKILEFLGLSGNTEFITLIIRKGAHFTEYCILYILLYRVASMYKHGKSAIILSILLTFGYACSDEFHQMFVPGRGPAIKDVMIDTSGGIFGIILCELFKPLKKSKFN